MNPSRILIIQLRRVGDVVFTLPVIGALRRHFPNAQIDFLVEKPADQLVRLHPDVNEVLVYDKNREFGWIREVRRRKYDWALDFLSNGRTLTLSLFSGAKVRAGFDGHGIRKMVYNHRARTTDQKYLVEQKLDLVSSLGVKTDNWSWGLKIPKEIKDRILQMAGAVGRKRIGIACVTRRKTREWLLDRVAELSEKFLSQGYDVLFLWGPGEKSLVDDLAAKIRTAGKGGKVIVPPETTIVELAALAETCELVVAVDNGPKNLAAALGVPTVTVHGPTNPRSFNPPDSARHPIVRDDALHCIACGLNQCPYQHECMTHVSVEQVFSAAKNILDRKVNV